jgi:hypothetical protein
VGCLGIIVFDDSKVDQEFTKRVSSATTQTYVDHDHGCGTPNPQLHAQLRWPAAWSVSNAKYLAVAIREHKNRERNRT